MRIREPKTEIRGRDRQGEGFERSLRVQTMTGKPVAAVVVMTSTEMQSSWP